MLNHVLLVQIHLIIALSVQQTAIDFKMMLKNVFANLDFMKSVMLCALPVNFLVFNVHLQINVLNVWVIEYLIKVANVKRDLMKMEPAKFVLVIK